MGRRAGGTGVGDKLRRALTFPEPKPGCSGAAPAGSLYPHPEHTYRAIMIPATPVCMARLASSYDKMSPFPEGQRLGPQGAACRWECRGFGSSRQPSSIPHWGRRGPRQGVGPGAWPPVAGDPPKRGMGLAAVTHCSMYRQSASLV